MPDQSPGSNNDDEEDDDSSTRAPAGYNSPMVAETQLPPEHILVPSPVRIQQRYPLRNTPDRQHHQATRYVFVNDRNRSSSSVSGPPIGTTSNANNNTTTVTTSSNTGSKRNDATTDASKMSRTTNASKTSSKSQPPTRTKAQRTIATMKLSSC